MKVDREFRPIERFYLGQSAEDRVDATTLAVCKDFARTYAVLEGAVVVLADAWRNRSYCFYGNLAERLGLPAAERPAEIPSLYENFIFDRADKGDLVARHAYEIAFLKFAAPLAPSERRRYYLRDRIRLRDRDGAWMPVDHRLFFLAGGESGTFWLGMCVYSAAQGECGDARIFDTFAGEARKLDARFYDGLLTAREIELLRLVDVGLSSKLIAARLGISVNTVNRHRQDILVRLQAANAHEACHVAKAMGLIG